MSKTISIHSYRGGTGKSNTTANLAALLAKTGATVGVVDTDIQSPGIHVLFGLDLEQDGIKTLNDYLWGKCEIDEAAHDVTKALGVPISGKVLLIPSSIRAGEIARVLREGYDVGLLNDGFQGFIEKKKLDYLLIDTHPGLNEETLLSIAISQTLIIILRPDQQDFQGTAVTVDVAKKLDVENLLLVVNKTPTQFNFDDVQKLVEEKYGAVVGAVLPHSDEVMTLQSNGVFVLKYPDHEIVKKLQNVVEKIK